MSQPPRYLDGDTIAEVRNAYGSGVPIETLAARIGLTVEELRQVLGLPLWKTPGASDDTCDLWAADALSDRL